MNILVSLFQSLVQTWIHQRILSNLTTCFPSLVFLGTFTSIEGPGLRPGNSRTISLGLGSPRVVPPPTTREATGSVRGIMVSSGKQRCCHSTPKVYLLNIGRVFSSMYSIPFNYCCLRQQTRHRMRNSSVSSVNQLQERQSQPGSQLQDMSSFGVSSGSLNQNPWWMRLNSSRLTLIMLI